MWSDPDALTACGCGHPNARPPCSWCTRDVDEELYDDDVVGSTPWPFPAPGDQEPIAREETAEEAYDRAMKPLG